MDAKARVAKNLQQLRRESDLTQEELAYRSRIHQTYLSGLEGGKTQSIYRGARAPVPRAQGRHQRAVRKILSEAGLSPDNIFVVVLMERSS